MSSELKNWSVLSSIPIPEIRSVSDWKDIKIINPSKEKLVNIAELPESLGIIIEPKYWLSGINGAIPEQNLRETAYLALKKATQLLPQQYRLKIWDAYRPLGTQQGLFDEFWKILASANPLLNSDQLMTLTQNYVSIPSENSSKPSPH